MVHQDEAEGAWTAAARTRRARHRLTGREEVTAQPAGCLLVLSGSTLTLHCTQYTRRTSTLLSERTMLLFRCAVRNQDLCIFLLVSVEEFDGGGSELALSQ